MHTTSPVSESVDTESENYSVVIKKTGSHSVKSTELRRINWSVNNKLTFSTKWLKVFLSSKDFP